MSRLVPRVSRSRLLPIARPRAVFGAAQSMTTTPATSSPSPRHSSSSSSSSDSPPPPSSSFTVGPAPPRLAPEEQAEFERLQREAAISSGFREEPVESTSSASPSPSPVTPSSTPRHTTGTTASTSDTPSTAATSTSQEPTSAATPQDQPETKGTDFNAGIFRGAPPEFDGEKNPRTGEVGGPKNEPLRWGDKGDWSYNGRVTDF